MQTFELDLARPPAERWAALRPDRDAMLELFAAFVGDLSDAETGLAESAEQMLTDEWRREIEGIATAAGVPWLQAALGSLYYDLLKVVLGCTTILVETERGPVLARNLDWWNPNGVLTRHTVQVEAFRGDELRFRSVGWPGFAGVMTGVAPGRFAVALNAVSSDDPVAPGRPVVFVLRELLESAPTFDAAVEALANTPLPCDAILSIAGARPGERAVVERTPRRSAVRRSDGPLVATNDYRELKSGLVESSDPVLVTSCGRFEAATRRLKRTDDLMSILRDRDVQMSITTQQILMRPSDGRVDVRLPPPEEQQANGVF